MTQAFPALAREFPDFDQSTLPDIPDAWDDASWRNDACPSFEVEAGRFVVFVDYANASQREFPETPRFSIRDSAKADAAQPAATDEWPAVLAYVVGETFADVLAEEFSAEEFAKMRTDNAVFAVFAQGACASHDFCDANEVMAEAFRRALGREPNVSDLPDGSEAPDVALWNAAWGHAKAARLTAPAEELQGEQYACSACDWRGPESALVIHTDADGRRVGIPTPGGIPDGDCPVCGAGAWPVMDDEGDDIPSVVDHMTAEERQGWREVGAATGETLESIVREMLEYEADRFDGAPDTDLNVSGADLVDAFTGWRERLRAALARK